MAEVRSLSFLPSIRELVIRDSMQTANSTQTLIAQLTLENAQQHRISTVIIGSFDIAMAVIMMASILWDTYSTKKEDFNLKTRERRRLIQPIQPAEVFAFIASVAVLIQGAIFVGVQSSALQTYTVSGCTRTAQIVWPAVWLFPITVLVFAFETSIRSLWRNRFCPRGTWATPVCLGVIVTIETALWLSAFLQPAKDQCTGSLVVFTSHYASTAIVLAIGVILFLLICGSVITIQLIRTVRMDREQRIMATRVVYTIGMSVVILAFLTPYYIQTIMQRTAHDTSHMSDIVLNLAGIFIALLHMFLRTNSDRVAIRSREAPWTNKRGIRLFGPNDLNIGMVISTPLLLDPTRSPAVGTARAKNLREPPLKIRAALPGSPHVQYANSTAPFPPPRLSLPPKSAQRHNRSTSRYSVFPTHASLASLRQISWTTVTDPADEEVVVLPPPLHMGHRRDVSEESSETVQIGLRLSHAMEERSVSSCSLHLPKQVHPKDTASYRRSPLSMRQFNEGSSVRPLSVLNVLPRFPAPGTGAPSTPDTPSGLIGEELEHYQRRKMKSLPPVPAHLSMASSSYSQMQPRYPENLISPTQVEMPHDWV